MSGVGSRRLLLVVALATAVLIGFFAAQNLGDASIYYLTPTEARDRGVRPGTSVRLGGMIEKDSLRYDPVSRDLRFVIGDGLVRTSVIGNGAPPALLREGAGAVVEGVFGADGRFRATNVIAKHDEVYAPPPPGATPSHAVPR